MCECAKLEAVMSVQGRHVMRGNDAAEHDQLSPPVHKRGALGSAMTVLCVGCHSMIFF